MVSDKENDRKDTEGSNKNIIFIAGIIVLLAIVMFMIGGKKDGNKPKSIENRQTQETAFAEDDGWVKVLRANNSDVVVMQFVLRNLPQCAYFHFKTLHEGRAIGVRCFEKSDRDKPDYYYVLTGTAEFLGPYKNEKSMIGKLDEMLKSLAGTSASSGTENMPEEKEESEPEGEKAVNK